MRGVARGLGRERILAQACCQAFQVQILTLSGQKVLQKLIIQIYPMCQQRREQGPVIHGKACVRSSEIARACRHQRVLSLGDEVDYSVLLRDGFVMLDGWVALAPTAHVRVRRVQ